MSKGRENKHKDFYVVRQSTPTSKRPSNPNLRISLSKPSKTSNAYNWLPRCQWTFTTERLSSNLFTQVSHTLKHSQNLWGNKNYNKKLLKISYTNWRTKMIQCIMICKMRAQYILCAFYFCLQEGKKMNWIWVYIVWAQKLVIMCFWW